MSEGRAETLMELTPKYGRRELAALSFEEFFAVGAEEWAAHFRATSVSPKRAVSLPLFRCHQCAGRWRCHAWVGSITNTSGERREPIGRISGRHNLTKALGIFERLGTLIEPDKVRAELAELPSGLS